MAKLPEIEKKLFTPGEKRTLSLNAAKLDPKHLVGGKAPMVEATFERSQRWPSHEGRFYGLTGDVRVQLNHGDPADDEQRLVEHTESFLMPMPEGEI